MPNVQRDPLERDRAVGQFVNPREVVGRDEEGPRATVSTKALDVRELNIGCYRMLIVKREHHVELATDDGRSLNLSRPDTRQLVVELTSLANWLIDSKEPTF